jgi:hypothetical protein
MWIIKTFAQNHRRSSKGATFSMMDSSLAHETTTSTEEQISICIRKMLKSIESVTVHSNGHTRGKHGVFIEDMPVGVVV